MSILVYWMEEWFEGNVVPGHRFILRATRNKKYADMGFKQYPSSVSTNPKYKRTFTEDPGFEYYPFIKYNGQYVFNDGFDWDAHPQIVKIRWLHPEPNVDPPDKDNWIIDQSWRPYKGWYRCVSIDDLEKQEGPGPDWSDPDSNHYWKSIRALMWPDVYGSEADG